MIADIATLLNAGNVRELPPGSCRVRPPPRSIGVHTRILWLPSPPALPGRRAGDEAAISEIEPNIRSQVSRGKPLTSGPRSGARGARLRVRDLCRHQCPRREVINQNQATIGSNICVASGKYFRVQLASESIRLPLVPIAESLTGEMG